MEFESYIPSHSITDVRYQPGAQMHLSDAISRLSTHDNNTGKTIENLDVSVHSIEELTGFNSLSVGQDSSTHIKGPHHAVVDTAYQ